MSTALNAAARQSNLAREDAVNMARFAALPPDERAAMKLEYVLDRRPKHKSFEEAHPVFMWFYESFPFEKWKAAKRRAYEAKHSHYLHELLLVFVKDLDLNLMLKGNKLTHVLIRHHEKLKSDVSVLMTRAPEEDRTLVTMFDNCLQYLVATFKASERGLNVLADQLFQERLYHQRDFGVKFDIKM